MNRRHRPVAALIAVFALVFAQLAIAAHACAFDGQSIVTKAMASHVCCQEGDSAGGTTTADNLCVAHCHHGHASLDSGQPVTALTGYAGSALRVDSPDPASAADGLPAWLLAAPAAPPPVAILFGVLRI